MIANVIQPDMRFRILSLFVLVAICAGAVTLVPKSWFYKYPRVEYLIPRDELPANILNLALLVESLPSNTTLDDFGNHVESLGLNKTPDHWKDYNYYWIIPQESNENYVLTANFSSTDSSPELTLASAAIRPKSEGSILGWTPVWRIYTRRH